MIDIANLTLELQGLKVMFHEWIDFAKMPLANIFKQKTPRILLSFTRMK